MLDAARRFFPKQEVLRLLDVMFRLRLNKFHWHIADDQGFRIALPDYPKLEAVSSRRSYTSCGGGLAKNRRRDGIPYGGCYTGEDVREVIDHAAKLGIEVIPELDMPGHTSAIMAAYPELSCSGEPMEVPGDFGILTNVLCLGNDEVLKFMEGLVHALCDLFGARKFHIGFDEVRLDHLKTCPKCQAKMKALGFSQESELKRYAKNFFRDSLKKWGIEVIIYNDGMDEADLGVICFHWDGRNGHQAKTVSWINAGQPVIMAPCSHVYMDYPYLRTPLKKTYGFNPVLPGIEKPENIIGVEAPLWTEYVEGHEKLAFNVYYRIAALAQIGWNGPNRPAYQSFMKNLRSREDYYFGERLNIPEPVLNPGAFQRFRWEKKCFLFDMNLEFRRYQERRCS
jgi:hexosaminidase